MTSNLQQILELRGRRSKRGEASWEPAAAAAIADSSPQNMTINQEHAPAVNFWLKCIHIFFALAQLQF